MKKLSFVLAAALALSPSMLATRALAESATNADAAPAASGPATVSPAPALVATGTNAAFAVAMVTMSDTSWAAIRYEVATGKAWKLESGSWRAIPDTAAPPASQYRVDMVPLKNDWGAIRVDVRSGRSWSASPEGWVEIAETH